MNKIASMVIHPFLLRPLPLIHAQESLVNFRDMQKLVDLILDHNRLKTVHPGVGFLGSLKARRQCLAFSPPP